MRSRGVVTPQAQILRSEGLDFAAQAAITTLEARIATLAKLSKWAHHEADTVKCLRDQLEKAKRQLSLLRRRSAR
jgi:hypothetical protein